MAQNMEKLYNERMDRYWKANHKEKPDKVPFRPFAAECMGAFYGLNTQQVTHDVDQGLDAIIKACKEFDIDATVLNMVYVWTGYTESYGTKYFGVPGIDLDVWESFQYREPRSDEEAWMRADEYDRFIADPVEFTMNVWAPRISKYFVAPGEENTMKNNLAWLKAGMGFFHFGNKVWAQISRMREEAGTVSCLKGALKAPFDILADKYRGFRGISYDIHRQPEKVLKATEAVAPHMYNNAVFDADPEKKVPISHWMHRGATGFFSEEVFKKFYWPTLREVTEEIWKAGYQTIYYAEGKWGKNLRYFLELPEGSIIFHCDKDDIFEVHRVLGKKFAISGGVPNDMLAFGKPEDVRKRVKEVIETVGKDGGFLLDAEAIMQQDTKRENFKAMADACAEYGVY
jgi:uroporphyrinogen-III decarboxylase